MSATQEKMQFIELCVSGKWKCVKRMIREGISTDTDCEAAIRWAGTHGDVDTCRFLVARGANIHIWHDHPIFNAATTPNMPVLKYFFEECKVFIGAHNDTFRHVALLGYFEVIRYLTERDRLTRCYRFGIGGWGHGIWETVASNSINLLLYIYQVTGAAWKKHKYPIKFRVPIQHLSYIPLLCARLMILVNLVKGCMRLCNATEIGEDPYYDSNLGMLVLTYVD